MGLFLTLFLPWYQESVIALSAGKPLSVSTSVTGWAAFSFVEAAVLVVAAGVLTLLFQARRGPRVPPPRRRRLRDHGRGGVDVRARGVAHLRQAVGDRERGRG